MVMYGRLFVLLVVTGITALVAGCSSPAPRSTAQPAPVVEAQTPTAVSQAVVALEQIDRLTTEVRVLTNQVEILQFELTRVQNRQKQVFDDIDYRLRELERGRAVSPGTSSSTPVATAPTPSVEIPGDESDDVIEVSSDQTQVATLDPTVVKTLYDEGFNALRGGKYEDAISKFQELVSTYPGSELVDDSIYWIAEANYVTQEYDQALDAFERVVTEYPSSQRAPEAMLKTGYIHYTRENFEVAKEVLAEVVDRYPASRSAFSARRRLNKMERDGL